MLDAARTLRADRLLDQLLGGLASVELGCLTRDQAKQQLERLEAVHDLYWRHGYGFDGTREELAELGDVVQSASIAQFGPAKVPSTVSSDVEEPDSHPQQEQAA